MATGRIKLLAVTGPQRNKQYPDVPTLTELRYGEGDTFFWVGVTGPKGLPANVVKAWNDVIQEAIRDAGALAEAAQAKKTWAYLGPEQFKAFVMKDHEIAASLATALKLKQ